MRLSTVRFSMTLLAASGAVVLSAGSALAQSECAVDSDCEAGFVCEVVGGSTCGSPAPCPDGEECELPEPCESEVFYGCVQGPCSSDADCGEGMICQESVVESCGAAAPACDPDGNCADVEPVDCEAVSNAQCVYQWQAGCTVDADCGDGFTCVEEPLSCACGGSTDADFPVELIAPEGLDGGAPMVPEPEPEAPCVCESSGSFYCRAQEIECMSDADCPELWTCATAPQAACGGDSEGVPAMMAEGDARPAPLTPAAMDAGAAEAAEPIDLAEAPPPDAPVPPPGCEDVVAPKSMCAPPGDYRDDSGGVPTPGSDPAQGPDGENTGAPGEDPTTAPLPQPGAGPDDNGTDETEEELGTDNDEVNTDEDAEPATSAEDIESSDDSDDEPNNNGVEDDAGDSGDSGGCSVQVAASGNPGAAWLLGLLGLGLLRRRRG